jgi:hypothetical protein
MRNSRVIDFSGKKGDFSVWEEKFPGRARIEGSLIFNSTDYNPDR